MDKNKSHIFVIFSVIVILAIIGLLIGRLLQPKSFGEYGHYRWNAVEEIQKQEIINQKSNTCEECHKSIFNLHEKDAHYNVPCIDCHGAANLHVAFYKGDSTGLITKEKAYLEKDYKLEGCLYCHRKLKARPSDFPQIDQQEHYKFLNVTDPKTKCIECHSPHEPIFLLTDIKQSRLHPVVYRCTECHDKKPEKSPKEVQDHPTVFECSDCHKEIAKDFSQKQHHNYVECRTCHLFHRENETTGRIYKNGNAKFCLLCHEKKPFKNEKYPPKIDWPGHVGNEQIIAKADQKICLSCHSDKIHKMDLSNRENPHSINWKIEHREIAKGNSGICNKCHTPNDCSSCHMKNKPSSHNEGWKKLHSKTSLSNKSSCELCHQKNPCNNCHKIDIPHPKDFADTHKELIAKKGKELCSKCHKEEFCKECH
jgi:hypothetical protein